MHNRNKDKRKEYVKKEQKYRDMNDNLAVTKVYKLNRER
jgi:hypothetical protein